MPFLTDPYYLIFYGGEPLLCIALIQQTVSFLDENKKDFAKTPRYSLTTNGSLITDEVIRFLEEHKFLLEFSFDGYAQDSQRKKGNFKETVLKIEKILQHPDIRLEVNSVFTPETVGRISESMAFLISMGVKNINLSLSMLRPWNSHSLERLREETAEVGNFLLAHYRKTREIPVKSFREENTEGLFYCAAGQDRMAITSEAHVWGCDLFADYFRGKEKSSEYQDYFFGDLDTFARNHEKIYPKISSRYARLSMDNFATPHRECLFCADLESCSVCPMVAALSGAAIGRIPSHICAVKRINMAEQRKFWDRIR